MFGSSGLQPDDDVARVRDASDIVEVIGDVVTLKPKGREYMGLCPFHDDRNPSMSVVPHKQIFHCFVCGTGGDVFKFVRLFHQQSFPEALAFLAERAGIELKPRQAARPRDPGEVTTGDVMQANEKAAAFFQKLLEHGEHGKAARAVIEQRGITPEMVAAFALGASPDRWDGLGQMMDRPGWDRRASIAAGLLKPRDDGSTYDAFRNRLMFPIQNQVGKVIAFGARKINPEDEPKYLNSSESAVFDKSASLYGLHRASRPIRRERRAIIVEGYTDVIACHQAGFDTAVATLGTALTAKHATVLRRMADEVVLVFDGDEAGQRAANRAAEVFFAETLDVRVATLDRVTDAKDPDELLKREGGGEVFAKALAESPDILAYRFDRIAERLKGAGPAALEREVKEELARLVELGLSRVSPMRRQLVIRRLAEITGLGADVIAKAVPAGRSARPSDSRRSDAETQEPVQLPTRLGARASCLGCVMVEPELWAATSADRRALLRDDARAGLFESAELGEVAALVFVESGEAPDLSTVLTALGDRPSADVAVALHERVRSETDADGDRLRRLMQECAGELDRGGEATGGSVAEKLARLREQRERHASNPRALPPSTLPGSGLPGSGLPGSGLPGSALPEVEPDSGEV
ncbi:MAG: DNA primase [Planctomycetota bacterium]